jgi:hypothetical protein
MDKVDKIVSPAAKQPFIGRSKAEAIYRATRIYLANEQRTVNNDLNTRQAFTAYFTPPTTI